LPRPFRQLLDDDWRQDGRLDSERRIAGGNRCDEAIPPLGNGLDEAGIFGGVAERVAHFLDGAELLGAGYTNVRRYQYGMPGWRTMGGVAVIEPEQLRTSPGATARCGSSTPA
jgi:hypothetical protein